MTVKSKKRGRPGKNKQKLEKEAIVQTAGDLTLKGSRVPSIRRLAQELNVDPMAIYHYFSNKNELLEAVTLSLVRELYIPSQKLGWKENLLNLCRSYITLLLDYPDLVGIFLSTSSAGAASVFMERFKTCVAELNLNEEKIKTITDLLGDYIHGFTYAAACNRTETAITIDMADGPLGFIIENIPEIQT